MHIQECTHSNSYTNCRRKNTRNNATNNTHNSLHNKYLHKLYISIFLSSIIVIVFFACPNPFKTGEKEKCMLSLRSLTSLGETHQKKKREGKRREWRNPSFSSSYLTWIRPLWSELGLDLLRSTVLLGHQLGQTALVDQDVRNLLLKLVGNLLELGLAENDALSEKHSHHFTISFL
nr:MAG TPA: hypothetical protein [Caudoviricetes sp.]